VFDLFSDAVMSSARRYCGYRGVPVDYVDDVLSEARLRAALTLERNPLPPEDFTAWFIAVVRNTIADYWKVKGPEVPLEDWMWRPQADDLAPEANATIDVGQFFRRVGPLLSERDQHMLSLYLRVANKQMTQVDMAKALDAEPKSASMLVKGLQHRIQDAMLALAYLDDPGQGEDRCGFLERARSRPLSEELRKDITRHLDGGRTKPPCATCQRRRAALVTFVSGIASALPIPADLPAPPQAHLSAAVRSHGIKATLTVAAAVTAFMVVSAVSVGSATYRADPRWWPQGRQHTVSDIPPTTPETAPARPAMVPPVAAPTTLQPARAVAPPPTTSEPPTTSSTTTDQPQSMPEPPTITAPAIADSQIATTCGRCRRKVPTTTQFSVLVTAPDGVATVVAQLEINGRTEFRPMRNVPGTSTWVGVVGPYRAEAAGSSVSISVTAVANSGARQNASIGSVAVIRCADRR
jgi:DNA-directed RNA polymerase specialized sigma24 family protein